MKQCPNCRTTYTDDTLQFCLQDGTPLSFVPNTEQPTASWNEPETVIRPRSTSWEQSTATQTAPPKKSSTLLVVLLTAFLTILLFAGGVGAWLFMRNRGSEIAVNSGANNSANISNQSNKTPTPTASPKTSPTSTPANSNVAPATPAPTVNAEQIKTEVSGRIDDWNSAHESGNVNSVMSNYADRLDYYYNSANVSADKIRSDKQRAFAMYDTINFKITNMRVTPDSSGDKATAVFDKEWEFEGAENYSAGKVQSQLQLTKIGGKWYVSGEKDLKVYYKE